MAHDTIVSLALGEAFRFIGQGERPSKDAQAKAVAYLRRAYD